MLLVTFNFTGNLLGFSMARIERSLKKYKKQWILKKNPKIMSYQTAIDTLYEPKTISSYNTDKLSESFIKYDRLLKYGFTRQLLINVLTKV